MAIAGGRMTARECKKADPCRYCGSIPKIDFARAPKSRFSNECAYMIYCPTCCQNLFWDSTISNTKKDTLQFRKTVIEEWNKWQQPTGGNK